ncbi:shugoshin [Drosophila takahashii]|uniref:shugoshin n=1 Tax=Drosophila takahashii TaxID=29030 RepID=UPI001CF8FA49|nr:shugoshin [Drosophila takahashii]
MATKVEMQYKLLNAELMEQVQKQRLEIGEYRKRVITLERENMDLREEHILDKDRQRLENIDILRSLMQRLNVNSDSLESSGSQEPTPVVSRPNPTRRSSREICRDIRRTCALARTTRTISPRRSTSTISTSSTSRRSSAETISEVEATLVPEKRVPLKHTPPPRRLGELLFDEDDSEEDSVASPVHRQGESNNNEEEKEQEAQTDQNQENNHLFSIIEENDSETEATDVESSSCEAIYCDTTIDSSPTNAPATETLGGRALREVDINVPEAVSLSRGKDAVKSRQTEEDSVQEPSIQLPRRGKHSSFSIPGAQEDSVQEPSVQRPKRPVGRPKKTPVRSAEEDSSAHHPSHSSIPGAEEEPSSHRPRRAVGRPKNSSIRQPEEDSLQESSIQCARLAVTRPSHSSGIFPDVNGSTPRRSLFNGIGQVAGSTSTPIPNGHKSSAAAEKKRKKSEQTEMSSSFFSSSGRPSRSCRPTSLVERNLRDKMRNESKGKARK